MKLSNLLIVLALCSAISQVRAQKVIRGTNTDVKYANTTVVYKDSTATDNSVLTQLDNESLGVGDVVRITTPPPKPKPAPAVPTPVVNPVVGTEVQPPVVAPVSIGSTIGVPVVAQDNLAPAPATEPERAADPVPAPVVGAKFDLVASSDPAVFLNRPNVNMINNINYVPNNMVSPNIGSKDVNDYEAPPINQVAGVKHPEPVEAPVAIAAPAAARHTSSGSVAHAGGRSGLKHQGWSFNLFGSKSYHKRGVQRYNCYRFK
jgi:hypothetical protein